MTDLESPKSGQFTGTLLYLFSNRSLFVNSTGFVEPGSVIMQAGDRVCAVMTAAAAMILRPKDDHWLLVEEVYLYPQMLYGDALQSTPLRELNANNQLPVSSHQYVDLHTVAEMSVK